MTQDESILHQAVEYLQGSVKPNAAAIDSDPDALGQALNGICSLGLMALKRPAEYGGPGVSEEIFRRYQEECARVSGSFSFLQTQHQSAVSMLSKSENDDLKRNYLPHMHDGGKLVGIGFSQLRRSGPPIMRAEKVPGGYRLNGSVPWITGWTFYPEFLIGATLPDGQCVFGVVPLVAQSGIDFSPPMRLAAMESAQTVSGQFTDWLMPDELVAFIHPSDWIRNNDMINIALQGHFALGCARAGLDILLENAEKKPLPFLKEAWEKLDRELKECGGAITETSPTITPEEERLKLRAWAIELCVRCAHAAITSSSGAANSVNHPAQRVYREALVYTVSAQTTQVMEATLARLTHKGEA